VAKDDDLEKYYDRHFEQVEKRESRADRKKASARDRSKYKLTDARKQKKDQAEITEGVRGRVLSISSAGITVEAGDSTYLCSLRGALKKEASRYKNLVVVGDHVRFQPLEGEEGSILGVEKRRTVLSRADNLSRNKEQLLAANIDQVLITVSVVDPILKPGLVDRYLIATWKGDMEPVVVVNKIELLEEDEEQQELYELFLEAYREQGLQILPVSCKTGEGLDELRKAMQGKASVFSGQSGVGKSSLINAVTGLELATAETVARTRKGSHTTTKAQMIPLEGGGWCIDTPGIKSFGVWDLDPDEIINYFSDLFEIREKCRYPNCRHRGEEGCVVPDAIEEGVIHPIRYASYLALVASIETPHRRR
jgi:ribosome biogenesis GTPase